MKIRILNDDDLDFAHHLVEQEGWDINKEELQDLIVVSPDGSFIAEEDGTPIGMAFSVSYGALGFIGDVIVSENHRGRGIATKLMHHAVGHLNSQGIRSIQLDAVLKAVSLYERIGFRPVCKSLRFSGTIQPTHHEDVHLIRESDLQEVFKLDYRIFGFDRSKLLKRLYLHYPEYCMLMKKEEKIGGFIMAIPQENRLKIGPWIVKPEETEYHALLDALVKTTQISEVKLGTLESNELAVKAMNEIGLEYKFHSLRMVYGESTFYSKGVLAIGGPDRG